MTVKEAAKAVLKDSGEPLDVHEITRRILAGGLWHPTGKTPRATVEAQLSSDIKKRGPASPFVRTAPRTYGLKVLAVKPALKRPKKPKRTPVLSFTEAAIWVLEHFGNKKPMHYRHITKKAFEECFLQTSGKTPEATMYAQIIQEIKRYQKRGESPRFVQYGKGYVGLSKWMGKGIAFDVEQNNRRVRQELHKRLLSLSPTEFEEQVARLLAEIGFDEIEVTQRSKDGGIDARGTLVVGDVIRTRMAVQVKRWKKGINVLAPVVQQVRGSLGAHEQGLIITTSDFSQGAREEAIRPSTVPVGLMNGEQLVILMTENEVGVSRHSLDLLELGEESR